MTFAKKQRSRECSWSRACRQLSFRRTIIARPPQLAASARAHSVGLGLSHAQPQGRCERPSSARSALMSAGRASTSACPQPAEADISPKKAASRFDPLRKSSGKICCDAQHTS